MSSIIYKWGPINFESTLYRGKALHVGLQLDEVFVWAEAEINSTDVFPYRAVKLHPTGIPYEGNYLGTVIMPSGLVWHVVEPHTESNLTNYGQGSEPWLKSSS